MSGVIGGLVSGPEQGEGQGGLQPPPPSQKFSDLNKFFFLINLFIFLNKYAELLQYIGYKKKRN